MCVCQPSQHFVMLPSARIAADPCAGESRFAGAATALNSPRVDVADLLARATAMVPADVVNEAGVTVADVREYLDHDEWEVALDLLADFDGLATDDRLVGSADRQRRVDAARRCRRVVSMGPVGEHPRDRPRRVATPVAHRRWPANADPGQGHPPTAVGPRPAYCRRRPRSTRGTYLGGVRPRVATRRHRVDPPRPAVPSPLAAPAAGHDDHHARGPARCRNRHHHRDVECTLTWADAYATTTPHSLSRLLHGWRGCDDQ
jgi:hypothetical protein